MIAKIIDLGQKTLFWRKDKPLKATGREQMSH